MHTLESNYFAMTKELVDKRMDKARTDYFNEKSWSKKFDIKTLYFDFADIAIKLVSLRKRKY